MSIPRALNPRWLGGAMAVALGLLASASAQHRVLLQGNERLAILAADGSLEWEMPWGSIHDVHVLTNGHILVQRGAHAVAEIDPQTREVVGEYDSGTHNGNAGRAVEVHALQPLGDDRILIAESGPARLIEIDRAGKLLCEIPLRVDQPHPHMDTRLVRKTDAGTYLVCHEGDGFVREYSATGDVVWEYEIPLFGRPRRDGHGPESFGNKVFAAVRLASGNTLIATGNGHSVLEVTPDKKIVWKLEQNDLPNITLAWVTTLEVLPNGHYVLGNCHAGPGNPILLEIEPQTKRVVWALDGYDRFGNNVSNSQLLDAPAGTRR